MNAHKQLFQALCLLSAFYYQIDANETIFDWDSVLSIPPKINQIEGNQILHFSSYNKPY